MADHDDGAERRDLDQLRTQPGDYEQPLDLVADQPAISRVAWIGFLILVTVVAVGLWVWLRDAPPTSGPAAVTADADVAEPGERPIATAGLGVGDPDASLPALSDLDAYVRPLLAALSRRPELAALLTTDDLVRRFVVSVEAIGRGATPARQIAVVAPPRPFAVRAEGAASVIDPASYARYDGLVRLVQDLDAQQLARLYGRLKPRLEDAHAELGVGGTFDATMTRALVHLLETPEAPPSPRVQLGKGTNYVYADADLEGLSAAQRQVLRLGPEGAARVKAKLRAFAAALGVPADQLPASS